MLCDNHYSRKYIEACEANIAIQVSAWQKLENAVRIEPSAEPSRLEGTLQEIEPHFFNNMALVLDCHFANRSRTLEKKDGNPLNELRMLCNALHSDNILRADKGIRYDPERAILGYHPGDEIRLNAANFIRLYLACFSEIKAKYLQTSDV